MRLLILSTTIAALASLQASEPFFELAFPPSFLEGTSGAAWRQTLGQAAALKIEPASLPNEKAGTPALRLARPSGVRIALPAVPDGPLGGLLGKDGLIGKLGAPVFVSFSFDCHGENSGRQCGVSLAAKRFPDDEGAPRISVGRSPEGRLQIEVLPARQYYSFSAEADPDGDKPRRVVLRIDPGMGKNHADKLTLWLDPAVGLPEPPSPHLVLDDFPSPKPAQEHAEHATSSRSLAFNEIHLYSGPMQMAGEGCNTSLVIGPVRIGSTWQRVQPCPP